MKYKFNNITISNPTFTFSSGNVVGEFVTVWANINGMLDWLVGAMPIGEDMVTWGKLQLVQYTVDN